MATPSLCWNFSIGDNVNLLEQNVLSLLLISSHSVNQGLQIPLMILRVLSWGWCARTFSEISAPPLALDFPKLGRHQSGMGWNQHCLSSSCSSFGPPASHSCPFPTFTQFLLLPSPRVQRTTVSCHIFPHIEIRAFAP